MKKYLTDRSMPGELIRFKKPLEFIWEVVRSYQAGVMDHIGFSCAIATSKAEELKNLVSPFSPAFKQFEQLTQGLKCLYCGDRSVACELERVIEEIEAYFKLDQYSLVRRS